MVNLKLFFVVHACKWISMSDVIYITITWHILRHCAMVISHHAIEGHSCFLSHNARNRTWGELPLSKHILGCVWHDYCGLGGRLLAEATLDPHSSSSLLQSSLCTKHSMKHNLSQHNKLLESLSAYQ